MQTAMSDANPPTTPDAISEFEAARYLSLPSSYRAFLLATNGGRPVRANFATAGPGPVTQEHIQRFLGLGTLEFQSMELTHAYDLYVGGVPSGIVPIANDDFANYVCLDLRAGTDRVAFWDKRHFWSTGEWREQDLYPVADTFDEFLSLLRPDR